MEKKIAVIGGDMRQSILAALLGSDGYSVGSYGLSSTEGEGIPDSIETTDDLKDFDAVILPMPVTQDGENINAPMYDKKIPLNSVMRSIPANTVVLGGKLPVELVKQYKQLSFYDYLEREDFAVKNAVATAEGALAIAINETPFTLWHCRCLVTGFGRISKMLIRMLIALGAHVDVAARKCSDRAWAQTMSCGAYDTGEIKKYIGNYDLIFNTVPYRLIDGEVLKNIKMDALVIDLASKPGGAGVGLDKKIIPLPS